MSRIHIRCSHPCIASTLLNITQEPEFSSMVLPFENNKETKSSWDKHMVFYSRRWSHVKIPCAVLHAQITQQCNSQRMYFAFYTLVWQVLIMSKHYLCQFILVLTLHNLFLIIYCTYEGFKMHICLCAILLSKTYLHPPSKNKLKNKRRKKKRKRSFYFFLILFFVYFAAHSLKTMLKLVLFDNMLQKN